MNHVELGEEISVFTINARRAFLGILSWTVSLSVIILLFNSLFASGKDAVLFALFISVIVIIIGIIFIFLHPKIRTHKNGFSYVDGKRSFSSHWEDILAIDFNRFPYSQIYGNNTSGRFKIVTKNGTTRKLNMMTSSMGISQVKDEDILSFFNKMSGIKPGYKQLR